MSDERAIRVVVADDQPIIREGLSAILSAIDGIEIVGVAVDGADAVSRAERDAADVVLMDLRMPEMDGIEATRRLAASRPGTAVVVLTTYVDDASVRDALRAGAAGYLTKHANPQDIRRALEAAVAGQAILERPLQARLVETMTATAGGPELGAGPLPDGLSTREGDVLALVAQGLTNAEIAARLFISRATVKTHINQILRETDCRDRREAILYALRNDVATG